VIAGSSDQPATAQTRSTQWPTFVSPAYGKSGLLGEPGSPVIEVVGATT